MVFVSSSGGGLFGRPAIQTESGTFFIFRPHFSQTSANPRAHAGVE
jgi:hypothetical protein